jgi:hypothetical protein
MPRFQRSSFFLRCHSRILGSSQSACQITAPSSVADSTQLVTLKTISLCPEKVVEFTTGLRFLLILPFSKNRDQWLKTKAVDTHGGKRYPITLLDPTGRTKKIEVKCYGNVLGAYREHPEAKFLGHDGKPCDSLTRGLLRRSHIVAIRHRYIGKETSRRWEQRDDPSMTDFRCREYSDGKMVADKATRLKIIDAGVRNISRETKVDTKTVMQITHGRPVKSNTLNKILKCPLIKPD